MKLNPQLELDRIPSDAKIIGIDTETDATHQQNLVCVTWCDGAKRGLLHHRDDKEEILEILNRAAFGETYLVGHNMPFDYDVLARWDQRAKVLLEAAAASGKILCTQIREQLLDVAGPLGLGYKRVGGQVKKFKYSLESISDFYLGTGAMDKGEDGWRMRFGELMDMPLDFWPRRAVDYALGDVENLAKIIRIQRQACRNPLVAQGDLRVSPDEIHQVRAAIALKVMGQRGMATDIEHVGKMRKDLEAKVKEAQDKLVEAGLMRAKVKKRPDDLSKNQLRCREEVEKACEVMKKKVPLTSKGFVSTAAEVLEELAEATPVLTAYHQHTHYNKMVKTYLRPCEEAYQNGAPIQPRYHAIKETGRTSCSGPNVQNLPRLKGMREIYCARPGHALVAADYDTAELRALGQVGLWLFGESKFAEFYAKDPAGDPHCLFASQMAGVPYEDMLHAHQNQTMPTEWEDLRASAKGVNFGAPGGLGADSMVDYLAGYGVQKTSAECRELLDDWKNVWGMHQYFRYISKAPPSITQLYSGRVRGSTTYCSRANTYFQGLIADAAKQALWDVHRGGLNLWAFIHDEIIIEVPLDQVDEAAKKLVYFMESAAQKWIPDVPMRAGAHAMVHWSKKAKRVEKDGKLIPDPKTE